MDCWRGVTNVCWTTHSVWQSHSQPQITDKPLFGSYISGSSESQIFWLNCLISLFFDKLNMLLLENRKCSDSPDDKALKLKYIIPHTSCSMLQPNMHKAEMYQFLQFFCSHGPMVHMNICSSWISSFSCGGKCLVGRNLSGQTDVSVQYWLLYFSLCLCSCVGIMWLLSRHGSDWLAVCARLTVRIIFRPADGSGI